MFWSLDKSVLTKDIILKNRLTRTTCLVCLVSNVSGCYKMALEEQSLIAGT
jgi:hypothetical protein